MRGGEGRDRPQGAEKGPVARRRPKAAGEAYSLYVEPAAEGANDADGPLSAACRYLIRCTRPATARTLRGAASQIAPAETTLQPMAIEKTGV